MGIGTPASEHQNKAQHREAAGLNRVQSAFSKLKPRKLPDSIFSGITSIRDRVAKLNIPADPLEKAKWSAEYVERMFDGYGQAIKRTKTDESLEEEEREWRVKTYKDFQHTELAAVYDRLGIISKDEKTRAQQLLQGPAKPHSAHSKGGGVKQYDRREQSV